MTLSDSSQFATGATVSNVEILNIRDVSAAAAAIDLASFSGLQQVWSKGSTQDAAVTSVQNAVTVGMSNTAKDFTVTYANDKLGSATATQAVALNGAINGAAPVSLTFTAGGADVITKLAVDSSTAKSNVQVAGVALTNLTVTGSAALTLAETTANTEFKALKTIDASGMTAGGLTLNLSGQGADVVGMTFQGSAGDDKLTLNSAHLTAKDTLAGNGGSDTLVLDIAGAASSIAAATNLIATGAAAGVSGFETLSVTAVNKVVATTVTLTVDASAAAGITKVVLGNDLGAAADAVVAVANLSDANTLAITASQTGVVAATYKPADIALGTDLGLTLELGAAKAAGITAASIAVTQTNNLTIKSAGTTVNTITELTGAQNTALKTLSVTGDMALTITNDLDVKALTSIDATGLVLANTTDTGLTLSNAITNGGTKGITISGSNGVDTIKGSALGDTIWGGLGADKIDLGTAGKTDIIRYTSAAESTATAKDAITVFEGARDLLKFEGFNVAGTFSLQTTGFTAGGNASALIASETLGAAADLSIDFNGDGVADMVISLAGVGTLTTSNFDFA